MRGFVPNGAQSRSRLFACCSNNVASNLQRTAQPLIHMLLTIRLGNRVISNWLLRPSVRFPYDHCDGFLVGSCHAVPAVIISLSPDPYPNAKLILSSSRLLGRIRLASPRCPRASPCSTKTRLRRRYHRLLCWSRTDTRCRPGTSRRGARRRMGSRRGAGQGE